MTALSGDDFRQAFVVATRRLEQYRDAINALNVFPVPDGDTGTNMLLTMRSAMEGCSQAADASVGDTVAALADGAFWGARGNSGVILSQFFKGIADALRGDEVCDGTSLVRALGAATDAAYRSVGQPVEGTMLTVIRSMSQAAREELARGNEPDALSLWRTAFDAAAEALRRTPSQLAVLKEAGVVDAGGMGVVVIFGAALCHLAGEDQTQVDLAVSPHLRTGPVSATAGGSISPPEAGYLASTREVDWGYCTQFLIEGEELPLDQVRARFTDMNDSAVVVGSGRYVRVHIHAPDPGPALSYGASLGRLSQVHVENMGDQNLEFVSGHRARQPAEGPRFIGAAGDIAVVAVAPGEGLAKLFREAGCAAVIKGGQTMNPSVRHILDAAESTGSGNTIVLPNNPNVVAAAEQAARASPSPWRRASPPLHVVPSRSVPQGVAAILAFNPEESLERNLRAMGEALATVASIEVTMAVRATTVGGLAVAAGQFIGLLEGQLVTSGDSSEAALESALERVGLSSSQVVTLYRGQDTRPEAAEAVRRRLESRAPGIQVDMVDGGQPHYHYLASVE
jgi:hypothetical protein